jgi:hypothetical protein
MGRNHLCYLLTIAALVPLPAFEQRPIQGHSQLQNSPHFFAVSQLATPWICLHLKHERFLLEEQGLILKQKKRQVQRQAFERFLF